MLKNVALPFRIFNLIPISGTTQVTSSVSTIQYHDSVALQFSWTGLPQGSFDVQGSIDYNQGFPQSAGQSNTGTWTSIPLSPAATITGSGGASNILVNMNQLAFSSLRTVYTNSTSSGVLTGWLTAKSLG